MKNRDRASRSSRNNASYSITPSSTAFNEGDKLEVKVTTTNLRPNTKIYWEISGLGINSKDFSPRALKGGAGINQNGDFTLSKLIREDIKTEGPEKLKLTFFSDRSRSQQVGNTSLIKINDTSNQAFEVIPSSTSLSEGDALATTIKTTGFAVNKKIHWELSGPNINKNDFTTGRLKGKAKLNANGSFKLNHKLRNDIFTEGNESLNIKFFAKSRGRNQLADSGLININDTSTQTHYTGNWSTIGDNSIFHRGFNVLTPGLVSVIVSGQQGQKLEAKIYGSSNYAKGLLSPVTQKSNPNGDIEFKIGRAHV